MPSATVIARAGHWRAFYDYPDCSDVCSTNRVVMVDDTGRRTTITQEPTRALDDSPPFSVFWPMRAAWLPGGSIGIVATDDDNHFVSPGAPRTHAPLWFGRGGSSWAFGRLDTHGDITYSDVVGRYGWLLTVYARPGQVVTRDSDGRSWHPAHAFSAVGTPSRVGTAVSLGRQFVAWSDADGLKVTQRGLFAAWQDVRVLTRAAHPVLLAVTAAHGRPTVFYAVSTAQGLQVRATTQQ